MYGMMEWTIGQIDFKVDTRLNRKKRCVYNNYGDDIVSCYFETTSRHGWIDVINIEYVDIEL